MTDRGDRIAALRAEREALQTAIAAAMRSTFAEIDWTDVPELEQSYWLQMAASALEVVDAHDNGLLDWLTDAEGIQRERLGRMAEEMLQDAEAMRAAGDDFAADTLADYGNRLAAPIELPERIRR